MVRLQSPADALADGMGPEVEEPSGVRGPRLRRRRQGRTPDADRGRPRQDAEADVQETTVEDPLALDDYIPPHEDLGAEPTVKREPVAKREPAAPVIAPDMARDDMRPASEMRRRPEPARNETKRRPARRPDSDGNEPVAKRESVKARPADRSRASVGSRRRNTL